MIKISLNQILKALNKKVTKKFKTHFQKLIQKTCLKITINKIKLVKKNHKNHLIRINNNQMQNLIKK